MINVATLDNWVSARAQAHNTFKEVASILREAG
jgi:hypothetical protein